MELQTKSNLFLVSSGILLLLLGVLLAYLLLPTKKEVVNVEVPAVVVEKIDVSVAPEGYVAPVRTFTTKITLPEPDTVGTMPVETAIMTRRSAKAYADTPITLSQLGQMLWAAQGISNADGKRTSPSRGAVYPITLFVVADNVNDLEKGLYQYIPEEHALGLVRSGDLGSNWETITKQTYPKAAPVVVIASGDMYKQYARYGDITERLVTQETGHIGQNMYLQAQSLGLGMVVLGGFDTEAAHAFLGTEPQEKVLYLIPIGNNATEV